MKTVEVTTELIKEVHSQVSTDLKQRIEKELPDLFNKLEFNRWLKDDEIPEWIMFFDKQNKTYGFDCLGRWFEYGNIENTFNNPNNRYATEEEVKTALVNEAVKRGFVEGARYNSLNNKNFTCNQNEKIQILEYYRHANCLVDNYGVVFDNGKWATLITEPTEKELLGDKIKDLEKNLEEVKSLYDKL